MSLAQGLYDAADYGEAAEQLAEILRVDDSDEDAHYGLARCHLASGKRSEAEAELREVLRLKPGYADYLVWRELCELLEEQDRGDEAVDLLQELKRISPRLEHCLGSRATTLRAGPLRRSEPASSWKRPFSTTTTRPRISSERPAPTRRPPASSSAR